MVPSLGAVWWGNHLAWYRGALYYFTWANGRRIVKKNPFDSAVEGPGKEKLLTMC
jgi:hypothetical protein